MSAFALILAITAGIALAVQGAANAALAHHVGRLEAAVISFLGGTLVLLGVSACIGELPQLSSLGEVPLWQCMGWYIWSTFSHCYYLWNTRIGCSTYLCCIYVWPALFWHDG